MTQMIYSPQEVGATLIGEDRLVVMTGVELVVLYQMCLMHSIHSVPATIMSRPPLSGLQ
jgi:hypothetical protein